MLSNPTLYQDLRKKLGSSGVKAEEPHIWKEFYDKINSEASHRQAHIGEEMMLKSYSSKQDNDNLSRSYAFEYLEE